MSSLKAQCPTCDKQIDAGLATVAKVVGTRIVTYCSKECAAGTPVVAAESEAESEFELAAESEVGAESEAESESAFESESESDAAVVVALSEGERSEVRASLATARRKAKRRVIAVASLFLVGGMLLTIIKAVSPSSPSDAGAVSERPKPAPPPAAVPAPAEDAKPVMPTPAQLRTRAIAELRKLLDSPSPRVRRISARALARTGDKPAIDLLAKELSGSKNQLARVSMAYAMARGGDDRGKVELVKLLKGTRRDVRLDAARSLIRLSDPAGAPQLRGMMSYRGYKIGAAGLLARIGDKKATRLLHDLVKSSRRDEDRQRAVVALGRAGEASMAPLLEKIIAKGPHVGAAHALAALGNEAAVPELVAQLDLAAIRVDAAVSLRKMGAEVELEPLAAGLASGREVARVSAAEAILVLTAPKGKVELE